MPPGLLAFILALAFAGVIAILIAAMALRDRAEFDRECRQLRAENDALRARCSGIETKGA